MNHNEWQVITYKSSHKRKKSVSVPATPKNTLVTRPVSDPIPIQCRFGSNCRLVKYQDGSYVNTDPSHMCRFSHPDEPPEELLKRTREKYPRIYETQTVMITF